MQRFNKKSCVHATALLIVVFGLLGAMRGDDKAPSDESERRAANDRKWTARRIEENGAVLRLMVPESSPSNDIPLNLVLQHKGEGRFLAGATGYVLDCVITLTSKDGKAIPYTSLGRCTIDGTPLDGGQYSRGLFTRGQLRSWEFNLATAFEPLKKGEYVLELEATLLFETPETKDQPRESDKFRKRVKLSTKDVAIVISSEEAATDR